MENSFECVILAGGKGERLWPLTQTRPKPLARVGGVSCLERCVAAAKRAGAKKITVSACYMAEQIVSECKKLGVEVRTSNAPLGTAGACRECASGNGHVLVLSGDGVFDFDLKKASDAHFASGSGCTVVLTECPSPTSYGCVTVKDGVITRFLEKPSWSHVCGDLVNTGIYFLSPDTLGMIPRNVPYDFSADLFPAMLDFGAPIAAHIAEGYWCDIGDPRAYYACCMRFSSGGNDVDPTAEIAKAASVRSSVICENARIAENAVVDKSVIGENCVIGKNALVPAGCVLGGGCVLGEGTALAEDVYLASGTATRPGTIIKKDVKSGMVKGKLFDTDEGAGGVYGATFSASESLDAGEACAAAARRIGVMWGENAESELLARAFICGARQGGASVTVLGEGCEGLAAFCANEYGLDLTAFFDCRVKDATLTLRSRGGGKVTGGAKTKIERAYGGRNVPATVPGSEETPRGAYSPVCRFSAALQAECGCLSGVKINLPSFNQTAAVFRTVCASAGASVTQEAESSLSLFPDGIGIMLTLRDGSFYERWQIVTYVLSLCADDVIALPDDAPLMAEAYLTEHGKRVERGGRILRPYIFNGAFAGAAFLRDSAERKRDPADLARDIPVFRVVCDTVEFPSGAKAARTGELCRECGRETPLFTDRRGSVRLIPDSPYGFRIIAEAASNEYAEELCDFGRRKLIP